MNFFCRIVVVYILSLFMINMAGAAERDHFYRNFWLPTYHGLRLNYCSVSGKECGRAVASHYCQIMGYQRADHQVIDHNVGLTHFISSTARCKDWRCNGFKTIRCVGQLKHKPPKPYDYRLRQFVYPRYGKYRVAWCYDGTHGCGKRAALSFCRRMGYLQVRRFAKQKKVAATKAVGNQKLCFGNQCDAFSYVTCYR